MESKKDYGNVGTKRNATTTSQMIELAKKHGAVTWYQKSTDKAGLWMTNQTFMAIVRDLLK